MLRAAAETIAPTRPGLRFEFDHLATLDTQPPWLANTPDTVPIFGPASVGDEKPKVRDFPASVSPKKAQPAASHENVPEANTFPSIVNVQVPDEPVGETAVVA